MAQTSTSKKPPKPSRRRVRSRDSLSSTRPFLIDNILPGLSLSIIGGPSGVGKTRWMFDLLDNWRQGNSIFGNKSNPCPFVYVATDRDYASVCDTLRSLGFDPETIPIFPAFDMEPAEGYSLKWLFKSIEADYPEAKLIILETAAAYVPGGKINDYSTVGKFCRDLGRMAKKRGMTVMATVHTAKVKGKEKYDNPREQLLGSGGGWGGFSETVFVMQLVSAEDPKSPFRSLTVLPRNTSGFIINYKFDNTGRLIPLAKNEKLPTPVGRKKSNAITELMTAFFDELVKEKKTRFKLSEALKALEGAMSRRAIIYRIEELCDEGVLARDGKRGEYSLIGVERTKQFEGVL